MYSQDKKRELPTTVSFLIYVNWTETSHAYNTYYLMIPWEEEEF